MKYISRTLEKQILMAVKGFPALVLTGPRRAGKTWILNHLFPGADYRREGYFHFPQISGAARQSSRPNAE